MSVERAKALFGQLDPATLSPEELGVYNQIKQKISSGGGGGQATGQPDVRTAIARRNARPAPNAHGDPAAKRGPIDALVDKVGGTLTGDHSQDNVPVMNPFEAGWNQVKGIGRAFVPEGSTDYDPEHGKYGFVPNMVGGAVKELAGGSDPGHNFGNMVDSGRGAAIKRNLSPTPRGAEESIPDQLEANIPVVGGMVAGITRQTESPNPAVANQGYGAMESFIAPAASAKLREGAGPVGRAAMRKSTQLLGKAAKVTDADRITHLQGIDKSGVPTGPLAELADRGGTVSATAGGLVENLKRGAKTVGPRISAMEDAIPDRSIMVDPKSVLAEIDEHIDKYAKHDDEGNIVLNRKGVPVGRTVPGDAAIQNLMKHRGKIASGQPIDIKDMIEDKRTIEDAVHEAEKAQFGQKLSANNPLSAAKVVGDKMTDVVNEATPDIAKERSAYHGYKGLIDSLKKKYPGIEDGRGLGGVPWSVVRYSILKTIGYGAGSMLHPIIFAGAMADALISGIRSTAFRTLSSAALWKLGKFLNDGDLAGAAAVLNAHTATPSSWADETKGGSASNEAASTAGPAGGPGGKGNATGRGPAMGDSTASGGPSPVPPVIQPPSGAPYEIFPERRQLQKSVNWTRGQRPAPAPEPGQPQLPGNTVDQKLLTGTVERQGPAQLERRRQAEAVEASRKDVAERGGGMAGGVTSKRPARTGPGEVAPTARDRLTVLQARVRKRFGSQPEDGGGEPSRPSRKTPKPPGKPPVNSTGGEKTTQAAPATSAPAVRKPSPTVQNIVRTADHPQGAAPQDIIERNRQKAAGANAVTERVNRERQQMMPTDKPRVLTAKDQARIEELKKQPLRPNESTVTTPSVASVTRKKAVSSDEPHMIDVRTGTDGLFDVSKSGLKVAKADKPVSTAGTRTSAAFKVGDSIKVGEQQVKVVTVGQHYSQVEVKKVGGGTAHVNMPNDKLNTYHEKTAPESAPAPSPNKPLGEGLGGKLKAAVEKVKSGGKKESVRTSFQSPTGKPVVYPEGPVKTTAGAARGTAKLAEQAAAEAKSKVSTKPARIDAGSGNDNAARAAYEAKKKSWAEKDKKIAKGFEDTEDALDNIGETWNKPKLNTPVSTSKGKGTLTHTFTNRSGETVHRVEIEGKSTIVHDEDLNQAESDLAEITKQASAGRKATARLTEPTAPNTPASTHKVGDKVKWTHKSPTTGKETVLRGTVGDIYIVDGKADIKDSSGKWWAGVSLDKLQK